MAITFQDYQEYLKRRLSYAERMTDAVLSHDDRLDFTNYLLIKVLEALGSPLVRPDVEVVVSQPGSPITNVTSSAPKNRSTFVTRQKNITTAGTAERLTSSNMYLPDDVPLIIVAKPANTGYIYIGFDQASAEGTSRFDGLSAGLAISLRISNAYDVWINSSVDGEGVSFLFER